MGSFRSMADADDIDNPNSDDAAFVWLQAVVQGIAIAVALLAPALADAAPRAADVADAVRRGIASGRGSFDHERWDGLLRRHVDGQGRVSYAGFARERAELDAYLAEIGRVELAALSRDELLALLVNAYNACTVRLILDGAKGSVFPPSIRELPDPWGRKTCVLVGQPLSLDAIEHGLVRALLRDARIHAAVNCAARSCPPLAPWAFRGEQLQAQLDERMRAMVNSNEHVRIEGGRLRISRIFDWYGGDFVDPEFADRAASLAEYVRRHARAELLRPLDALGQRPRIEFLDYDWSLNGR